MIRKRWKVFSALILVLALAAACGSPSTVNVPRSLDTTTPTVTIPSSITSSGDQSAALSSYLNGLASGTIVNFPSGATYHVSSSLTIDHTKNLTINGDGSTIYQNVAGPESSSVDPVMNLYENSDLAISDLTVEGSYTGSNGGDFYEGDLGWLLEANHGVSLTGDTTYDIQGDCIEINAPDDSFITSTNEGYGLNNNVTILSSTFDNCGYHGLTVEAADDLVVKNNTFENLGLDAMDFEYDTYSSGISNGVPDYAAEDNIKVTDNTFTSFCGDWFASLQGQTPGVAEHNILLAGNTINPECSEDQRAIEILGTSPNSTTYPYEDTNFVIEGNTWSGSDPISSDPVGMAIEYVEGLTITGNIFPYDNQAVMQLNGITGGNVSNNEFTGAANILYSASSYYTPLKECGNYYGASDVYLDASC